MSVETSEALPFDRIGGRAAIRRVVNRFYDLMDSDPAYQALRDLHAPDLGPMRLSLTDFLMGWLGGPRDWFEARPGVCMMKAHNGVVVTADTARQWRDAMARAFADSHVDPGLAGEINQVFGRMTEALRRD